MSTEFSSNEDPGTSKSEDGLNAEMTLVDVASSLHLQVAVAMQVIDVLEPPCAGTKSASSSISYLRNIIRISRDKQEIERILRVCYKALSDKTGQHQQIAHLDRDMMHLALDCLVDYVDSKKDLAREKQPWRFFLARIGVLAKHSALPPALQQEKLSRLEHASETLPEYIRYLYREIDIEQARLDPDILRILAMEHEVDRLQNVSQPPFRKWRQDF